MRRVVRLRAARANSTVVDAVVRDGVEGGVELEVLASGQVGVGERVVARVGVVPGVIKMVAHMSLRKSSSGKMSRAINRERFLAGDLFTASKKDAAA